MSNLPAGEFSVTHFLSFPSARSLLEFHIKGPQLNIPADAACFTMSVQAGIGERKWAGYYLEGDYVVRYVPKQSETLSYKITSPIPGFTEQSGQFVVNNQ